MIVPIQRWLAKKKGVFVSGKQSGIQKKHISKNALSTIEILQQKGYQAYIVGGAVRDILLGFSPKDFDIATDAKPEDLKKIFTRRARIIGRRFRIVHIYPPDRRRSKEILEVSTFRATENKKKKGDKQEIYGTAYDDAYRRDFTINALLYDPINDKIIDYVGGLKDLKKNELKMIGDPKARLLEDPVRALRAIRLSTKLGLKLDKKINHCLSTQAFLLADIPGARLFDELMKVIKSGASARILRLWYEHDIASYVLPVITNDSFFFSVMAENDRRQSEDKDISISFIMAALFWSQISELWLSERKTGMTPSQAMEKAIAKSAVVEKSIIPQRILTRTRELYFLQAAMEFPLNTRRVRFLTRSRYFDRALAFASSRQDNGAAQTASWWAQYVKGDKQERDRMMALLPKSTKKRKKT